MTLESAKKPDSPAVPLLSPVPAGDQVSNTQKARAASFSLEASAAEKKTSPSSLGRVPEINISDFDMAPKPKSRPNSRSFTLQDMTMLPNGGFSPTMKPQTDGGGGLSPSSNLRRVPSAMDIGSITATDHQEAIQHSHRLVRSLSNANLAGSQFSKFTSLDINQARAPLPALDKSHIIYKAATPDSMEHVIKSNSPLNVKWTEVLHTGRVRHAVLQIMEARQSEAAAKARGLPSLEGGASDKQSAVKAKETLGSGRNDQHLHELVDQGCSTLRIPYHVDQFIDACECRPVAVLA
jgi:hypothetical protein